MGQVLMQKTDEIRHFMTGIETTQGVGREDLLAAVFGNGCGHAGGEKSRENRVDADVRRAVTGRQVNHQT